MLAAVVIGSIQVGRHRAPSNNARATELGAAGGPDDAIVWDAVLDSAYGEVRGSWSF